MSDNTVIALDVGGSSVKSGIVKQDQSIEAIQQTSVDSKGSADQILATFAGIVAGYVEDYPESIGVGVGFPSPFDYANGISIIEGVDKYEAIYNINIGDAIRERVARPDLTIRFRNDAEAALIGEAIHGAAKPYQRFIGVTLGTGLGSSFIDNQQRITHGEGIPDGGFLFPVLFKGEQSDEWFSTRGLRRRLDQAQVSFPTVAEAAASAVSNPRVQAVFQSFGEDLAAFIQPFITDFGAEAFLVTGGIARAYPLFGDALEQALTVPVIVGELGTKAALLGAADLIWHQSS